MLEDEDEDRDDEGGGEAGKVWADILNRKHECYPTGARRLGIVHEGRRLTLLMPDLLVQPERLEVKATIASGPFLVVVGRHTMTGSDDPYERGILLLARKRDDETYVAHVWHELYPYALKYLGLGPIVGDDPGA